MSIENLIKHTEFETSATQEDLLFEQLALKKLKELRTLSYQDRAQRYAGTLKNTVLLFLSAFRRADLIRQVGPGFLPLEEHEWKQSRRTDSIR